MIDRRCAIPLALAVATLAGTSLLLSSAASAAQAFQRFILFLVDLPGWQGKKPDGLSKENAWQQHDHRDARIRARLGTP